MPLAFAITYPEYRLKQGTNRRTQEFVETAKRTLANALAQRAGTINIPRWRVLKLRFSHVGAPLVGAGSYCLRLADSSQAPTRGAPTKSLEDTGRLHFERKRFEFQNSATSKLARRANFRPARCASKGNPKETSRRLGNVGRALLLAHRAGTKKHSSLARRANFRPTARIRQGPTVAPVSLLPIHYRLTSIGPVHNGNPNYVDAEKSVHRDRRLPDERAR